METKTATCSNMTPPDGHQHHICYMPDMHGTDHVCRCGLRWKLTAEEVDERVAWRNDIINQAASNWPVDSTWRPSFSDWLQDQIFLCFPFLEVLRNRWHASMTRDAKSYLTEHPNPDDPFGLDILDVASSPQTELAKQAYIVAMRSVIHGHKM